MIDTVLLDIDGVLTDGNVTINADGKESKKFSFDDIDAVFKLKRASIKIGFITGEKNEFTEYVRNRFNPEFFADACKDKLSYFKKLEAEGKLSRDKTCFVGDSEKDLELLKYVSCGFAPSNADEEIRKSAAHVTSAVKGAGVVKEVAKFVLGQKANEAPAESFWKQRIDEHQTVVNLIKNDPDMEKRFHQIVQLLVRSFQSGGKLLICGNGGSAADSQHIATEFVSRFFVERKAIDAEALTVNTSTLTAIGNDYTFDRVYSRQVEAKGKKGDVLIAISTSGGAKNVLEAVRTAREMGMITIGLTGNNKENPLRDKAEYCISVPSNVTPRIQETHILIAHMICEIVEKELANK